VSAANWVLRIVGDVVITNLFRRPGWLHLAAKRYAHMLRRSSLSEKYESNSRVYLAIRAAPEKVFDFTYVGRAVSIVTGRSASGIPILVESAAVDHFVDVVCSIAPSFGAIQLEDIGAATLLRD
jgi:hypothetical protein